MQTLETAIRLIVIGQEILIALIFLFGSGMRTTRISGALFVLSVASYLFLTDVALRESIHGIVPLVLLLSIFLPYSLWAFARAIFESEWPARWVTTVFLLIGFMVWVTFVTSDYFGKHWQETADTVMHIVSLTVVLHALWLTAKGRPDDLMEHRRTFRVFFVVIIAIQILTVLIVELVLGAAPPPAWLTLGNVVIIALLTTGLAIPLLQLNSEIFEPRQGAGSSDSTVESGAVSAADNILQQNLLDLMSSGYHQQTGLTIRRLAEELACPEHRLRRLINGHLGYRNFSAFLNSYRIEAAKVQLGDPTRVRAPVLTLALDLGYASLGPFNRAFKTITNMTPTEYRKQILGQDGTDSE